MLINDSGLLISVAFQLNPDVFHTKFTSIESYEHIAFGLAAISNHDLDDRELSAAISFSIARFPKMSIAAFEQISQTPSTLTHRINQWAMPPVFYREQS